MDALMKVRSNVAVEVKGMQTHGTPYRQNTSSLVAELVSTMPSSLTTSPVSDERFKELVHQRLGLRGERLDDVAKSLSMHARRVQDEKRLAALYAEAEKRMSHLHH